MTTQVETLVPASNFEVRPLRGATVPMPHGEILVRNGYGIWDKAQLGFVSMHDHVVARGPNAGSYPVPYSLRLRRYAEEAVKDGLYAGYKVVRA